MPIPGRRFEFRPPLRHGWFRLLLLVQIGLLGGCSQGPPRHLVEEEINGWVAAHSSPSLNVVPGHDWKVRSFSIQRTVRSQAGDEVRVYGHLDAVRYDYQWNPPAEQDASGTYYFTFARDDYGKWYTNGGPQRD